MNLRLIVTAALLVCLAATAVAQLSADYTAWGQGPHQFLLTKEEAAAWKAVKSDAEAKAFVDLFWARRDPTPGTPANEYRSEVEARIQYADKNFGEGRTKGSMTDRGKAFLLYGSPKRMERAGGNQAPAMATDDNVNDATREQASVTWVYEDANTKDIFGTARAQLRFADRFGRNEFKLERSSIDLNAAQTRAIAKTIAQPALTSAPAAAATAAPAPQQPVAPAAPVVITELATDALKTAVAELKSTSKNPYENKAFVTWGEYVTTQGETFVPVGLYVPKASGISGDVTFFGVVEDATGKNVLAFEQPATLAASKDDFFIDKSLALGSGKHRGVFGLAQNGKVVALASTEMELAGNLDKDATAISQLLLSNNIYALTESQKADDPFAFGGVRVVPKADRNFRTSDELWYFFELRNPGLSDPATTETVPVSGSEVPRNPKIQIKIDVAGTTTDGKPVKMSAPPREAEAVEMKGVPGHFGVGNAIPLATFKPGDYTFTVKVIDTIKKTSYTLTEKFKVVG